MLCNLIWFKRHRGHCLVSPLGTNWSHLYTGPNTWERLWIYHALSPRRQSYFISTWILQHWRPQKVSVVHARQFCVCWTFRSAYCDCINKAYKFKRTIPTSSTESPYLTAVTAHGICVNSLKFILIWPSRCFVPSTYTNMTKMLHCWSDSVL